MNILVVGDIMIDEYVHVSSNRKAMESSLPVWEDDMIEYRLGGAVNVANNLKTMSDCKVALAGILGDHYEYGFEHLTGLGIEPIVVCNGPSMYKRRYVTEHDGKNVHLLRHDIMARFPEWNLTLFKSHLPYMLGNRRFDAIIFSDYDKGTIDAEVVEICRKHSDLLVVDSKREDLRLFAGCTLLKLNESEYSSQVSQKLYESVEALFQFVVVTRGAKPTQLRVFSDDFHTKPHGKWMPAWNRTVTSKVFSVHSIEFPVERADVVDVTGCGDTHVAAMTISLVHGNDINHAIRYANAAARDVVQRFGTSVPGN